MSLPRISVLSTLLLPALLLHGCASLEPEAAPDWRSPPETVKSLADTNARDDGSRVVVGNSRSILVLDGEDGSAVGAMGPDSILEKMQVTVRMVGTPLAATLRPRSNNILMLDEAGLVLVFDYEGTREQVTALDMNSGEQRWQLDNFSYSIQQYEETLRRVTSMAGSKLAAALGGQGGGESIMDRRERQRHFAKGLAAPVDNGQAIVFKTFDGLVKLNAGNGREIWRVQQFNGPGILELKQLGNGDYLVLSRGRDLSNLQAAESYNLARISRQGRVRWISEHAGKDTRGLQVAGDRVFVDGEPMEVFSLSNGSKLWSSPKGWAGTGGADHTDPRARPEPEPLITDSAIYQAAFTHGEDGEFVSTGFPHKVRSFNARTGKQNWSTDETDTFYGELKTVGNQLIVWGAGEFFDGENGGGGAAGLDRRTGEVLWRTPAMATPGAISKANWVVEPVLDARREHLFIAGPEDLYGVRLADGETVLSVDLGGKELGSTVGLARHGDSVVVVGQKATAAFAIDSGEQQFRVATEHVADFEQYGDRLVLQVTAGGLAQYKEGGPDEFGLVSLNLDNGRQGELVVAESDAVGLFGVLAEGQPFITDDGHHAFFAGEDGRLIRYSL